MVKMNNPRGGANSGRGRQKLRPLFPPGELPLFGPPPAYMRRPPGPPIPPPARHGPMGPFGEFGPPPPPPLRPPHLGPPMVPHVPHPMRRRTGGPPPPPMPLLQAPVMPPRHLPFMRGRGMPRLGPGKKLPPKNLKKAKNKKNKKPNQTKTEDATKQAQKKEENVLEGPWISDAIKAEIEKMNELKKSSEASKAEADIKLFNEQKDKVNSMASAAKMEYIGSQPETKAADGTADSKNGVEEQK